MSNEYAPGMRLNIRGEEWLLRNVAMTPHGTRRLDVTGLSPMVRDREAVFMADLEESLPKGWGRIEILDPRNTQPVRDDSPYFRNARLHLEVLMRQAAPSDARIHRGNKAAIDVLPYQLEPSVMALRQPRQRILIADAVGLGKTIECGILLSELIKRGRARRILVLTGKSMLKQFMKELWTRFSIPLVRLDSAGIARIRREIPSNQNPFSYYDKTIISIDTLKQAGAYRRFLEDSHWDVIVIDEAHNIAARGDRTSQRAALAEILANKSDSLILLSATPHDGRKESFFRLIARITAHRSTEVNSLYITGDAHQRIYGRKVVLSRCGINVRGRSRRLRVNYRTTEETRRWATAVLDNRPVDDLDNGTDTLKGYRSLTRGVPPQLLAFRDSAEEIAGIAGEVRKLQQKTGEPAGICIVVRTGDMVETYRKGLVRHGIQADVIEPNKKAGESKVCRIATFHRVKGLEFDYMILAGMDEITWQADMQDDDSVQQARCLIHVAATRARKRVLITASPALATFINVAEGQYLVNDQESTSYIPDMHPIGLQTDMQVKKR